MEGPLTASCPATVLQLHPHATVVVDEAAAAQLFDRVSFAGDRRVEHCCSRYRGDRYEIVMAVDGT